MLKSEVLFRVVVHMKVLRRIMACTMGWIQRMAFDARW